MSAIEAQNNLDVMITYGVWVLITPYGRIVTRIECLDVLDTQD